MALELMEDSSREFYTSQLVKLELLPKACYHRQAAEIEFYQTHFEAAKSEEPLTLELGEHALRLASKYGIAAVDALHVAAAIRQGAEEFITTEKPDKPIFRVKEVRIKSLYQRDL